MQLLSDSKLTLLESSDNHITMLFHHLFIAMPLPGIIIPVSFCIAILPASGLNTLSVWGSRIIPVVLSLFMKSWVNSMNQSDIPNTRLICCLLLYNAVALPEINIPIPNAIKNSGPNNSITRVNVWCTPTLEELQNLSHSPGIALDMA